MIFGYTGNILHINLSKKNVWIEHPSENFYRTFGGGRGIALFYMLKNMKQSIDPFSEDNLLIFSTSAPVGSVAPGINRYTVCSKSPLTGAYGESEAGGWWGPELKKSGFDAIVIKGKSKNPVYLFINDGKIEIKDASHIWGKDTGIVQEIIKQELGDRLIKILQIGIAGENLVRFSNIVNELSHFNGRNGLGAIMGSKKIKAIAVRGTKAIKIHDKERFKLKVKEINKRVKIDPSCQRLSEVGTPSSIDTISELGCLPSYHWSTGYFEKASNLSVRKYKEVILKGTDGCFACPIRCKRVVEFNDLNMNVNSMYGGPEFETIASLGSNCGIDDLIYIAKANELCNKYTMDTISTGMVISFAMKCYQEGIITKEDTNGLDLSFGNKEALIKVIEDIARKLNFGKILAEGSLRAAEKIGKNSNKYVYHVKGQEIPMHDPRVKTGLGLQYALSDCGADHLKAPHDTSFIHKDSRGVKEMNLLGILSPVSPTDIGKDKVKLFKLIDISRSVLNIFGACIFAIEPSSLVTMEDFLEIIKFITGWRTSWFELMKIGERSINMARIFNLREGITYKDDILPEIFFSNFKGGPLDNTGAIDKNAFYDAIKLRYELMGWDKCTGVPNNWKLIDLDLEWLIDEVNKIRLEMNNATGF